MFGRIARRYDLVNTIMTLGLDRRWRNLTAHLAGAGPGILALDVATGTGELALELARTGCRVIGLDYCSPMLALAKRKSSSVDAGAVGLVAGDGLQLPFPDNCFECATTGFALRNFADLRQALAEIHRVLKPGGRVACLELTPPTGRGRRTLYRLYLHGYVPFLGKLLAGDGAAYSYLPHSVERFPTAQVLIKIMWEVGFREVKFLSLGLGMVAIHHGRKQIGSNGR
jgi:demethylmenaquinone methyltransferase/2-methoxy-6-polyprenyl-1,4-benzoquinol methylase